MVSVAVYTRRRVLAAGGTAAGWGVLAACTGVQCYLHSRHTEDYAPQGWFAPAERTVRLGRPVRLAR